MRTALTIAGSDSGGGAGIQADLKTFAAQGVFGMSAITAITAQNTCGVTNIRELDDEIIADQIAAVFDDIRVDAVKVGMLSSVRITKVVTEALKRHGAKNIVIDPVMVAKSGSLLLLPDAVDALRQLLLPLADVVTPNLHEATALVGFDVTDRAGMERAAVAIKAMGPRYVVVKGGHLPGEACDLLYDGSRFTAFTNKRIDSKHTHGTGCTFSSAIAAGLAKGLAMEEAVQEAKVYITTAIQHGFSLGKGVGPTHHFYELYRRAGMLKGGGE
ncbi:MAG: bifunctional hydroxymethylpyrimidine kinase/phosphomethylpyrimidine kinase [Negativicutes bacterium]|nr:bifunctional hydroxymethylpyrimidine kinase/phosphomethylpyrimidine kinase [Negativicutes bacterium]MDR3589890.1 bifunctional hydroxymethylpyrimidine kinase/phosphomethylpyrimidine kinase [Negativicutes bacterium]